MKHHNAAQVKIRRRRRVRRDAKKHSNNLQAFIAQQDNRLQAAVQTLTVTGNAVNAETVTIDAKVYTWDTALANTDGHVKIAATAALSLLNLFNAINNTGGGVKGTDYATAMTTHPTVVADAVTATTLQVRAKLGGTAGNSKATTETMTLGSFGAATLAGGNTTFSTRASLKKRYGFRRIKSANTPAGLP